jgi:hypothetical protein
MLQLAEPNSKMRAALKDQAPTNGKLEDHRQEINRLKANLDERAQSNEDRQSALGEETQSTGELTLKLRGKQKPAVISRRNWKSKHNLTKNCTRNWKNKHKSTVNLGRSCRNKQAQVTPRRTSTNQCQSEVRVGSISAVQQ